MTDLRSLYQEVILDHYKQPRNFGELDPADRRAEGYNPLCGDHIKLALRLEDDRISEVCFEGAGCAISTAAASLMTESVKGRSVAECRELVDGFHALLTQEAAVGEDFELGKLEVLSGVREYPVRIKCATLAFHALRAALDESADSVTTE